MYGIPYEYLGLFHGAYAYPSVKPDDYNLLECDCPGNVVVMNSEHSSNPQIVDWIKRGHTVNFYSNGSVEESFFYCERQMTRDVFYLGGNAAMGYKVEMSIWEGNVTYKAQGNVVSLGLRKK